MREYTDNRVQLIIISTNPSLSKSLKNKPINVQKSGLNVANHKKTVYLQIIEKQGHEQKHIKTLFFTESTSYMDHIAD